MTEHILIPVTLDGSIIKKDKSASLRFVTELELTRQQNDFLFNNHLKAGMLYFRASKEQPNTEELDNIEVDLYDSKKSQSKRIRDVLYIQCNQHYGRKPTDNEWKEFYKIQTEKIIQSIKNTLE